MRKKEKKQRKRGGSWEKEERGVRAREVQIRK